MKKISSILIGFALFACFSCVQETTKRTVTFNVDARNVSEVKSMSLRGQHYPLSWRKNYALSDDNNDSIFTTTITFDLPFDYTDVKFVLNDNTYELKDKPNRRINFENDTLLTYSATFDVEN